MVIPAQKGGVRTCGYQNLAVAICQASFAVEQNEFNHGLRGKHGGREKETRPTGEGMSLREERVFLRLIRVIRTTIKQILRGREEFLATEATRNHTEKGRRENNVPKSASLPCLSVSLPWLNGFSTWLRLCRAK
jgi:hypothetical protein